MRARAVWVGLVAVACSGRTVGDHPPPGDDAGEAAAYCPATLEETNGHVCGSSGLMCAEDFLCNDLPQQTVCTCKSSRFECSDPIGLLPPGHAPRCLSTDPKKFYCPESMALAEGLTCTANGQSCFYDGAVCSNGLTKLNYCECAPDGFGGFVFGCHVVPCEPDLQDAGFGGG
jgi:hypothetical protein